MRSPLLPLLGAIVAIVTAAPTLAAQHIDAQQMAATTQRTAPPAVRHLVMLVRPSTLLRKQARLAPPASAATTALTPVTAQAALTALAQPRAAFAPLPARAAAPLSLPVRRLAQPMPAHRKGPRP